MWEEREGKLRLRPCAAWPGAIVNGNMTLVTWRKGEKTQPDRSYGPDMHNSIPNRCPVCKGEAVADHEQALAFCVTCQSCGLRSRTVQFPDYIDAEPETEYDAPAVICKWVATQLWNGKEPQWIKDYLSRNGVLKAVDFRIWVVEHGQNSKAL